MFCGKCGKENIDGVGFCIHCGTDLSSLTPAQDSLSDTPTIVGGQRMSMPENMSLGDVPTIVSAANVTDRSEVEPSIGDMNTIDSASGALLPVGDRFEIIEKIGSGGMGAVYKANDKKLGRMVALKCLHAQSAESKKAIERFWREAKVVASLNHFNIIQVFDIIEDRHKLWIVMEYVPGGSLQDKLQAEGAFGIEQIRQIGVQIAEALSAAHEKGVFHRDIKPANILLTEKGTPKLGDFGLAHETDVQVTMTLAGSQMGTMYYASPEQMTSGKNADARSDIYSLGATLYALATGQAPRSIRLDRVDENLRDIISKCLEEHPKKRYQNTSELIAVFNADQKKSSVAERFKKSEPVTGKITVPAKSVVADYTVVLKDIGNNLIGVIKEICATTGLSLKESKYLAETTPTTIKDGLTEEDAHKIRDIFERVGATVELKRAVARKVETTDGQIRFDVVAIAPFGSDEARQYQEQTAEALGVPIERSVDLGNGVNMVFVLIPPGEFDMGSASSEEGRKSDEGPVHRVKISKPFYMGKFSVTNGQHEILIDENPSYRHEGDLPVQGISLENAVTFCEKLSYICGKHCRLPTEAEWEYACRAGTDTRFYFGDDGLSLDECAWYYDNSGERVRPVGQKKPNAFGLYDMHGNIEEWCNDWYKKNYYSNSPHVDPQGPSSGKDHVFRGGNWAHSELLCRSSDRNRLDPAYRYGVLGFRVVMEIK